MNLVDYHTHTILCGHAVGSIDEYINRAITIGLAEIGFSDHAPVPPPHQEGITMKPEETELYIAEIQIRKKTNDSIRVKLGFEVDFPLFGCFNNQYLTDTRFDYLIGSCHFLGDWLFDHPDFIEEYTRRDINDVYREYYSVLLSLVQSGYFNIVGHFDLVKKFGYRSTEDMRHPVESIAAAMARNETAVEINTSGLNKPVKEIYPSESILKILFGHNVPVTLGSDSHSPETIGHAFSDAVSLLKKIGYRKISGFASRKRYNITL